MSRAFGRYFYCKKLVLNFSSRPDGDKQSEADAFQLVQCADSAESLPSDDASPKEVSVTDRSTRACSTRARSSRAPTVRSARATVRAFGRSR